MNVCSCPAVVEVTIVRPDLKYQLGFSVQEGMVNECAVDCCEISCVCVENKNSIIVTQPQLIYEYKTDGVHVHLLLCILMACVSVCLLKCR